MSQKLHYSVSHQQSQVVRKRESDQRHAPKPQTESWVFSFFFTGIASLKTKTQGILALEEKEVSTVI